ncbi:HORMA domain-containing protein 2 isoform X4 [Homo sapiens]|uniref:HORMA domain-containing protein 2 isoform X4 n=1 Tax=Homo sapiens TaxID=9606 RepID=UPI0007DC7484|nr:HORMA domain-containing protein 2 isoform X4 [Homo sapiens]XP_054181112.1 HORMA domain-containing protein 2 isoform X4 [Homo sapiens]|eukprot:XP_016884114.1 HORMA domain-containing protein 2 isoform X5 [Homo sapiens]
MSRVTAYYQMKVTEMYQFKFKYTKEGATMDFDSHSSSTSFESGTNNEDIKKASVLLIRKLYILMQDLEPLPNNVVLTMKLHYYNAVTPHDYQPLGFKEGVNSHFLLFDKEPINVQVGFVSTGFHSMKVKVMTEATKVIDLENNLFRENSTTEIAHQGLDCDEEEECNDHGLRQRQSPSSLHPSPRVGLAHPRMSQLECLDIPAQRLWYQELSGGGNAENVAHCAPARPG